MQIVTGEYGIQETMDAFDAVRTLLEAVEAKKADDGKVTKDEYVEILFTGFPSIIKAVQGGNQIPKELAELSDDELNELKVKGYGPLLENPHATRAFFHLSGLGDAIFDWTQSRSKEKATKNLLEAVEEVVTEADEL